MLAAVHQIGIVVGIEPGSVLAARMRPAAAAPGAGRLGHRWCTSAAAASSAVLVLSRRAGAGAIAGRDFADSALVQRFRGLTWNSSGPATPVRAERLRAGPLNSKTLGGESTIHERSLHERND
jgi:hypothetical protein